ncbi:hypothetical protein D3C76_1669480 [compost metagenome]
MAVGQEEHGQHFVAEAGDQEAKPAEQAKPEMGAQPLVMGHPEEGEPEVQAHSQPCQSGEKEEGHRSQCA